MALQRWRVAMAAALYGEGGFYLRPDGSPAPAAFRTSVTASPLFAGAMLSLLGRVDEALGRPDPFDLVDIGAGRGTLLARLVAGAAPELARRLRPVAVELARRPAGLPERIGWRGALPGPGSVRGAVLATEWLDNVPLDLAAPDRRGRLRYRLVDPVTGAQRAGGALDPVDAAWAARWWPDPGVPVELGTPRDEAWRAAVATLSAGLAVTVDYGHVHGGRPAGGSIVGFHNGRIGAPALDGSTDVTAHVAIDAVAAAGSDHAGVPALLLHQAEALRALGVRGQRPPLALAGTDPAGYVRALAAATQAAELTDLDGLGGHWWVLQPVGPAADHRFV